MVKRWKEIAKILKVTAAEHYSLTFVKHECASYELLTANRKTKCTGVETIIDSLVTRLRLGMVSRRFIRYAICNQNAIRIIQIPLSTVMTRVQIKCKLYKSEQTTPGLVKKSSLNFYMTTYTNCEASHSNHCQLINLRKTNRKKQITSSGNSF